MNGTEAERAVEVHEETPEEHVAPLDAGDMMDETTRGKTRPRESEAA